MTNFESEQNIESVESFVAIEKEAGLMLLEDFMNYSSDNDPDIKKIQEEMKNRKEIPELTGSSWIEIITDKSGKFERLEDHTHVIVPCTGRVDEHSLRSIRWGMANGISEKIYQKLIQKYTPQQVDEVWNYHLAKALQAEIHDVEMRAAPYLGKESYWKVPRLGPSGVPIVEDRMNFRGIEILPEDLIKALLPLRAKLKEYEEKIGN